VSIAPQLGHLFTGQSTPTSPTHIVTLSGGPFSPARACEELRRLAAGSHGRACRRRGLRRGLRGERVSGRRGIPAPARSEEVLVARVASPALDLLRAATDLCRDLLLREAPAVHFACSGDVV
jgi:hypothetical protein